MSLPKVDVFISLSFLTSWLSVLSCTIALWVFKGCKGVGSEWCSLKILRDIVLPYIHVVELGLCHYLRPLALISMSHLNFYSCGFSWVSDEQVSVGSHCGRVACLRGGFSKERLPWALPLTQEPICGVLTQLETSPFVVNVTGHWWHLLKTRFLASRMLPSTVGGIFATFAQPIKHLRAANFTSAYFACPARPLVEGKTMGL